MRAGLHVRCPIFSTLAGSFNLYDMPDCVLVSVVDGKGEGMGDYKAKCEIWL